MVFIFVFVSEAFGGQLPLRKGPFLLLYQGSLIVRIEEKNLKEPRLEWIKEGTSGSLRLERQGNSLWKVVLPEDFHFFQYRIVDDKDATDWISVNLDLPTSSQFTFAAYGDNRSGNGNADVHRRVLAEMKKENPAFILATGDMVYRGNNEDHWDRFFEEGRDIFASIPLVPIVGNHDKSRDNRFGRLFPLGEKGKNYYAFKYGSARFIALDTTIPYDVGSPQYNYLKAKLEEYKDDSPIIIAIHDPPFSGGKHGSVKKVRRYLVPLFEDYGVDMVFAGHDHNYQRIGPINGVLYIVSGGGGAPLCRVVEHPVIKKYKVLYHYLMLHVEGDIIKASVKSQNGILLDTFEINHNKSPTPQDKRTIHPKMRSSRFFIFH